MPTVNIWRQVGFIFYESFLWTLSSLTYSKSLTLRCLPTAQSGSLCCAFVWALRLPIHCHRLLLPTAFLASLSSTKKTCTPNTEKWVLIDEDLHLTFSSSIFHTPWHWCMDALVVYSRMGWEERWVTQKNASSVAGSRHPEPESA